jgi:hypothetical protein
MLDGSFIVPHLERRVGCPGGAVERAPLRLTPAEQSLNVDVDTPSAHAGYCYLDESLLRAGEPVVVRLLQLVAVRC